MKNLFSSVFPINTVVCFLALTTIIYSMVVLHYKPCPMCILQQFSLLMVFVFSVLAWVTNKKRFLQILWGVIIIMIIIAGLYIAVEQVFMQHAKTVATSIDIAPGCDAVSNPYVLSATKSIVGSIESCSDISDTIAGVSLAMYSLIFFTGLLVLNSIYFIINLIKK